ncbi:MAG: YMGG-like glycine zipper-containing protein [Opitutaceae bacterium]
MKKTFLVLLIAAAGVGSAQAEGLRPSVVQGAVLGGVAGAVIGNNSGNHNGGQGALIGTVLGALLGAAVDQPASRTVVYTQPAPFCPPPVVYCPTPAPVYVVTSCPQPSRVVVYQTAPVVVYQSYGYGRPYQQVVYVDRGYGRHDRDHRSDHGRWR